MMKKPFLSNLFWAFINVLAVGLSICTLVGFFGTQWWIFDLISHFRVQYFLGLLVLILIYGVGKRLRSLIISAVFIFVNLFLILPLFFRPSAHQIEGDTFRILYANVYSDNPQHYLLRELIQDTEPDIVVLLEINQDWLDDLSLAEMGYPYYLAEARQDNFGVALFSRFPIEESEIRRFGLFDFPSILADLNIDDARVTFLVTHAVPPKSEKLTWHRNIHLSEIANYISGLDGNIILAGDFNSTSWSPFFREWLQVSQLRDSRNGFGFQPTWPAFNWFFLVPIDHLLITSDIQVYRREVGPHIGSDHYPLILEFSLSDKDGDN